MDFSQLDTWEYLGEGSFAEVYKIIFNDQEVAVKRIEKGKLVLNQREDRCSSNEGNSEIQEEISREEEALRKLNHDNIVKLLDVQSYGDYKYFVLEYCQATLNQFFKKNDEYAGIVPSDKDALMQMTNGLAYIHEQKYVHRDLSPNNVLISNTSPAILKIADFGFCKITSVNGSYSISNCPGNRRYLAPELAASQDDSNPHPGRPRGTIKSDIFSLGCLFYNYITKGKYHPFEDQNEPDFLGLNIAAGVYHLIRDGLPYHVAYPVIEGMIQKNPAQRWELKKVKAFLENNWQPE